MILFLTLALQAAAPAPTPAAPVAPWTPRLRADPTTGLKSGSVSASSNEGNGRLTVRCDHAGEGIVSIQFLPTQPFAAATDRPVSIQIDGEPALGANWEFPGRATLVRDEAIVTTLSAAIARAKQIKIRIIDPQDQPILATLSGPPSAAPIKQVLEACGYVLGQVPARAPEPTPAPAQ